MIKLGVNVDHVATLRQARLTDYPDPVEAALIAEQARADSITVHLREDRRHIQEDDVFRLVKLLRIPLNLEMAVTPAMLDFASTLKPAYCCFVPEKREELTTEGGLDVTSQLQRVKNACLQMQKAGCKVSLFIDPEVSQIKSAALAGADMIELHTGHYAEAVDRDRASEELDRIETAVLHGKEKRIQVNAGHGLNYDNVQAIASIGAVAELNIGHSIVGRAVIAGMSNAVSEMRSLMLSSR